jgi:hypothetical protein
MRHILITLLFAAGFFMTGFPQIFNAGIIAGGNVSQVDGDFWVGYHKFGYQAGAFVNLNVSPRSSFQLELEYFQKGSRKNADSASGDFYTQIIRLHYIEVPLLYQYKVGENFSLEAGPAADISVGSYETDKSGQEVQDLVALRPVSLTGIFGMSYFITKHWKVNFRFNYSLLSIRQKTANYPQSYRHILFERGQFNNVLALSILYYFKEK